MTEGLFVPIRCQDDQSKFCVGPYMAHGVVFYNVYQEKMFNWNRLKSLVIYMYFACLFVSDKRENGWTDRAQILCGTSHDPRKGL